jgi:hypothetical protein
MDQNIIRTAPSLAQEPNRKFAQGCDNKLKGGALEQEDLP